MTSRPSIDLGGRTKQPGMNLPTTSIGLPGVPDNAYAPRPSQQAYIAPMAARSSTDMYVGQSAYPSNSSGTYVSTSAYASNPTFNPYGARPSMDYLSVGPMPDNTYQATMQMQEERRKQQEEQLRQQREKLEMLKRQQEQERQRLLEEQRRQQEEQRRAMEEHQRQLQVQEMERQQQEQLRLQEMERQRQEMVRMQAEEQERRRREAEQLAIQQQLREEEERRRQEMMRLQAEEQMRQRQMEAERQRLALEKAKLEEQYRLEQMRLEQMRLQEEERRRQEQMRLQAEEQKRMEEEKALIAERIRLEQMRRDHEIQLRKQQEEQIRAQQAEAQRLQTLKNQELAIQQAQQQQQLYQSLSEAQGQSMQQQQQLEQQRMYQSLAEVRRRQSEQQMGLSSSTYGTSPQTSLYSSLPQPTQSSYGSLQQQPLPSSLYSSVPQPSQSIYASLPGATNMGSMEQRPIPHQRQDRVKTPTPHLVSTADQLLPGQPEGTDPPADQQMVDKYAEKRDSFADQRHMSVSEALRQKRFHEAGGTEEEFAEFDEHRLAMDFEPEEDDDLNAALQAAIKASGLEDTLEEFNSNNRGSLIHSEEVDPSEIEPVILGTNNRGQRGKRHNFGSRFDRSSVRVSPWKIAAQHALEVTKDSKKQVKKELQANTCKECTRDKNTYLATAKNCHAACLYALKMKDKHKVANAPPMNVTDKFGASAVHFAARHGNLDMLQWLVENKADIRRPAGNGSTPAHDAAATGRLQCLQCLAFHEKSIMNQPLRQNKMLPIHLAAMFGQAEIVLWILSEHLSDPMARSGNGNTALHYAASRGHSDLVREMLHYYPKEKLNERNGDGATAMFRAAEDNHVEVVGLLCDAGADYTIAAEYLQPVHVTAQLGLMATLQYLIESDQKLLNITTADGATPCHFAAANGQSDCLRWLLRERGRQPPSDGVSSWTDSSGNTPIHDAAAMGQIECLKVLADSGMYLAPKNDEGKTPAEVARDNHHTEAAIFITLKVSN